MDGLRFYFTLAASEYSNYRKKAQEEIDILARNIAHLSISMAEMQKKLDKKSDEKYMPVPNVSWTQHFDKKYFDEEYDMIPEGLGQKKAKSNYNTSVSMLDEAKSQLRKLVDEVNIQIDDVAEKHLNKALRKKYKDKYLEKNQIEKSIKKTIRENDRNTKKLRRQLMAKKASIWDDEDETNQLGDDAMPQ